MGGRRRHSLRGDALSGEPQAPLTTGGGAAGARGERRKARGEGRRARGERRQATGERREARGEGREARGER